MMADLRLNVGINVRNEGAKAEIREVDQQLDRTQAKARQVRREVQQTQLAGAGVATSLPTNGAARLAAIRQASTGVAFARTQQQVEAITRVTGSPAAGVLGAIPGGGLIGQVGGLLNPAAAATLALTVGVVGYQRGTEQQEQAQKLGFDLTQSRRAGFGAFLNTTVGPVARSFTKIGRLVLTPVLGDQEARAAERRADRGIRALIDPLAFEVEAARVVQAGIDQAVTASEELQAKTRQSLDLPIQRVNAFNSLDFSIRNAAAGLARNNALTYALSLRQSEADWLEPSEVRTAFARRVYQ